MPVYTWEGRTRQGTTKKGVMEAVGEAAVMAQLRAQMITPIAVKAKSKDLLEGFKFFKGGPNTRDLVIFARQFATMIDAGLPLVQCLTIQADQQPKAGFKEVILAVKSEGEQGSTFADALGKEPAEVPELPPNASDDDVRRVAWEQMKGCYDPEIPINIVDLGLVYDCDVKQEDDGRVVSVTMTLTAPGCGMGEVLVTDVREKVEMIPTVKRADVELVFDPPWNQSMMSEAARLQTGMM